MGLSPNAAGREHEAGDIEFPNRELLEITAAFTVAFERWMASTATDGLSYPRLRILEELHCRGPAKLKTLADLVGLSARNLTALADALETEGLATRTSHPTDRRVTLLQLTDAGTKAADQSLAPRLARLGELFDHLSATERQQLTGTLTALTSEIDRAI